MCSLKEYNYLAFQRYVNLGAEGQWTGLALSPGRVAHLVSASSQYANAAGSSPGQSTCKKQPNECINGCNNKSSVSLSQKSEKKKKPLKPFTEKKL